MNSRPMVVNFTSSSFRCRLSSSEIDSVSPGVNLVEPIDLPSQQLRRLHNSIERVALSMRFKRSVKLIQRDISPNADPDK